MYSGQWWLPTPAFHYVLPLLVATCSFGLTLHYGKFNFGEGTLSFIVSEIPALMNWISRAKFKRVLINSYLLNCISSNLNHINQPVLSLRCLVEISQHDMLAFFTGHPYIDLMCAGIWITPENFHHLMDGMKWKPGILLIVLKALGFELVQPQLIESLFVAMWRITFRATRSWLITLENEKHSRSYVPIQSSNGPFYKKWTNEIAWGIWNHQRMLCL